MSHVCLNCGKHLTGEAIRSDFGDGVFCSAECVSVFDTAGYAHEAPSIPGAYRLVELEIYKGKVDWRDEYITFDSFAEAYKAIPLQEKEFSGSWGIRLDGDEAPFLVVINGLPYPAAHIEKCPECEGTGNVWALYPPFNPDSYPESIECVECAGTGILAPTPHKLSPEDYNDIPY